LDSFGEFNEQMAIVLSHIAEEEDTSSTDTCVDQKEVLEELGFASKAPPQGVNNDKIWHRRYEKLIEFYKTKEWQMSGANQVRPRQASALSHEVQQPTVDHCGAIGH
jgi:hypothetical protein